MKARCTQCGRAFIPTKNTTGRYCSLRCWYGAPGKRELLDRRCAICKKSFRPGSRTQKTCSRRCGDRIRRTAKRRTHCERCGKRLKINIHPKVRFCSKSCALTGRVGAGGHRPEGSKQRHSSGYVLVKVGLKWVLEHRHVMERLLGRPLEPWERVHHRNSVRSENAPENLELWIVGKKDPPGVRARDLPHCPTCTCRRRQ